jgi:hypothetical protein
MFVLYQQHSIILGDRPHRNRSLFTLFGEASMADTSR